MHGPDGLKHLMMVIMMAWVADLEEQLVISGVRRYSCPVCLASHQDLDQWTDAVSHTPCIGNELITETHLVHQKYHKVTTYEFKNEVMKRRSGLLGAIEEFCWENLPVSPEIFLTQDLLHGCYKFRWDHVAKWLTHTISHEELDCCFRAQPNLGFQSFANGISKISQAFGLEHRRYLKFIVVIIAGHENVSCQVLVVVRSLVDFFYLAHYPVILDDILEVMSQNSTRKRVSS